MPAALILRLARTRRLAIVCSGTRKARAVSSVVSPPSVRSVSATWASSASAGWQHVKTSSSRWSAWWSRPPRPPGLPARRANVSSRRACDRGDPVDRTVARGGDQPGARAPPASRRGASVRGDREGVLGGFLGDIEVAEEADETCEYAAPLVAEDLVEGRYCSTTGRTSTAPPMLAAGIRDASSIAASRSSASNTRYPPRASLTETNGPSVVSVLPFSARTVVAASGG